MAWHYACGSIKSLGVTGEFVYTFLKLLLNCIVGIHVVEAISYQSQVMKIKEAQSNKLIIRYQNINRHI